MSEERDYGAELRRVYEACAPMAGQGRVADYIPELARADPSGFGLCLHTVDGRTFSEGDVEVPFTIQSISKVLTLAMVLPGTEGCFRRVMVEPSGDPFNSLVQLEVEAGIPRNPFINAGALVTTDMLDSLEADPKQAVLDYVARSLGGETVAFDLDVARSEIATAAKNRAMAYLMQSFGNLRADVEHLLDVYCHHCAIEMTLSQVVRAFAFLANDGRVPATGEQLLSESNTRRVNALMLTCGFYDESGDFAYRVGLPGKSGVGGGIVTVLPGKFALGCWSPGLNEKGNSLLGMRALEMFTTHTGESLF